MTSPLPTPRPASVAGASPGAQLVAAVLVALTVLTGVCRAASTVEYRTMWAVNATEASRTGTDAFLPTSITPDADSLAAAGRAHWTLVSSYLETETAWPNHGNDSYVTGLQPNVRPQRLVMVFMRRRLGPITY